MTFPGVMKYGVAYTAANMDKSWIGTDLAAGLAGTSPATVETLNDADAAGLAEMRYGAGRDQRGVVLMLTFGTGIGSALFIDGVLVPNTEFGHIQVDGEDGEKRASAAAREHEDLELPALGKAGRPLPRRARGGLWPDLIIVGGGVSKKAREVGAAARPPATRSSPAELHNDAGIVGAALAAHEMHRASADDRRRAARVPAPPGGAETAGTARIGGLRRGDVVTMESPAPSPTSREASPARAR